MVREEATELRTDEIDRGCSGIVNLLQAVSDDIRTAIVLPLLSISLREALSLDNLHPMTRYAPHDICRQLTQGICCE